MRGYIVGIVSAALAIGVAECLIPDGAKTKIYLKLLFSLVLLLVVVKPLGNFISEAPDFIDRLLYPNESEEEHYLEIAEGEMLEVYREKLYEGLVEKFNLTDFSLGIKMGEDRLIETVTVTLMGKDIFKNPILIENYVKEGTGADCIVIVG